MPKARDRSLDGARGLAILIVVLYHATVFGQVRGPLDALLVAVARIGWSGVDLFFVLSGFLITRILLRERSSPAYFKPFYARRILRIFPLYYTLLVLLLVVVPRIDAFAVHNDLWAPNASRETLWYWLFLSNFHSGGTGKFHHISLALTWSLAIEEQFYLVWPALVFRLSPRTLRRVCWGAIAGAFVLRCAFTVEGASPIALYVMTPFRIDTLAVGALIAIVSAEHGGFERLGRLARYGLPVCFAACSGLSALLVAEPTFGGARRGLALLAHPLMQTLGYSLLAALYGLLVIQLLAAPRGRLARAFQAPWLLALGKYSYALYLLHSTAIWFTTIYVFDPRHHDWPFVVEQLLRYFFVLTLSLAAAWVSWRVLEAPAQRLRGRFPYRVGKPLESP